MKSTSTKGPSNGVTTPTPEPSNSVTTPPGPPNSVTTPGPPNSVTTTPGLPNSVTTPTPGPSNSTMTVTPGPSFTIEQCRRYEIRYEEGYDVCGDADYMNWLKINHPEAVPAASTVADAENSTHTVPLEPTNVVESSDESLAQHFSHVSPLSAVASNILSTLSSPDAYILHCSPNDQSSGSVISKYLVTASVSTPAIRKTPLPCARLLTSSAALQILKEKE